MKLLFIADPLDTFKIYKDSTFAMMREAQRRGHRILACEARDLRWVRGSPVAAEARAIHLHDSAAPASPGNAWYESTGSSPCALRDADAVVMRIDPPFDTEYLYATHLLTQAEREGARVYNQPQALREHPEKLAILEFAQFTTPTLVSSDMAALKAFHAEHSDLILKPLDGMGGAGIYRVREDGLNLGSILEGLTLDGRRTIMAQRYLPAIAQGDKRVLVIDGQPVPFALARIPQGGEVRGNLAAGGLGVAQPLTTRDREIAEALGPVLAARGLLLVGLDIIGDCLTEINVTSPTCFQEITLQTGWDVAARFIDALEGRLSAAA